MASNLHRPGAPTSPDVATAIAGGDLSKKITVNVSGEIPAAQGNRSITMGRPAQRLLPARVTARVARERSATEGRLGGQGQTCWAWPAPGRDLTESVNSMASNLTAQVFATSREVTTAVANGGPVPDKSPVDVRGEILGN